MSVGKRYSAKEAAVRIWFFVAPTLLLFSGCAAQQLKFSTGMTVNTQVNTQFNQVLDNLARFIENPGTMPYYAVIGQGTVQIQDSGSLSNALTWVHHAFPLDVFGIGPVSRAVSEQWTLALVTDPDKLKQIRCLLQIASGRNFPDCYDCNKILQDPINRFGDRCQFAPGWFQVGSKWDIPKCAVHCGHYGHTFVWVTPEGVDSLTRLTLAIQDIATFVPSGPQELDITLKERALGAAPFPVERPAARKDFYYPLPNLMFTPGTR
jgi:hypothetical protein